MDQYLLLDSSFAFQLEAKEKKVWVPFIAEIFLGALPLFKA